MPQDIISSGPEAPQAQSLDYQRIAAAIAYVMDRREEQPSLDDIAAHVGLSPYHFQRLFHRWAGVSPKKFLSYVTVEHAKARLEESASVLDAALTSGLSGSSRLHDLMIAVEAMTPGEYKQQGQDLNIRHGVAATPFGDALFLVTQRGLCGLEFIDDDLVALEQSARERWPMSQFVPDDGAAQEVAERIFAAREIVPILMKGTPWQIQVWSALLRIPPGAVTSYGKIAEGVCSKQATRAVGTAVAANHIGYIIPCHRVLRATGLFRRYRWGAPRRWAMLAREATRS